MPRGPFAMTEKALDPDQRVEITDAELVQRAVRNARPELNHKQPRWVCVMDAFGTGSTVATELCRRFGLNPHEELKPPRRTIR